jgi:hypothetical protein
VGDVVGLVRYCQRIFEALIRRLDRYEARVLTPLKGPLHALWSVPVEFTVNSRRSNFLSSLVPQMAQPPRHGWRIWRGAFHFTTIPPT